MARGGKRIRMTDKAGKAIKYYRKKIGITQSNLAEATGISLRTLQDYEQGRKPLEKAAAATVLRLSRVLGCNVEDLIDDQTDHIF